MATNNNPTTTSNKSWLDAFTGVLGSAGNYFLQYQDQKNKSELDKLQQQNSLNAGKQQLAIYEQNQIRANLMLWAVFGVAVILIVFILKKLMK